jgi:hypothetical protein
MLGSRTELKMADLPLLCSPPGLLARADQRSGERSHVCLQPSRPLEATFHSPNSGCPSPDHLCRIIVPGLPLRRHTGSRHETVRLRTPHPARFPALGRLTARHPFFALLPALPVAPRSLLRAGTSRSLPFNARRSSPPEGLPRLNARCPSLPAGTSFL